MQYTDIIERSPGLDLRIPTAFLADIQDHIGAFTTRRGSSETNDRRCKGQSDFWAHLLLP